MRISLFLLILYPSINLFSQDIKDSTLSKPGNRLPFAISEAKKLSAEDLRNKREGTYFTGVPDLSSDPVNGFGYGGEGSIYFNGKRTDPFFDYTAYRAKLDLTLFNTTRSQKELMIRLDVPYIFNTKWRLRLEAGYENNPNLLYFGKTAKTLEGLSYYPGNDSSKNQIRNVSYSEYKDQQSGNYQFYNTYIKQEYILNISGERTYMEGKLRLLAGYEIALIDIKTFNGINLLQTENNIKPVGGMGKNTVDILQVGLIYDTRDLETDPGNGIFAELTNELSLKSLGSAFNFNKTFVHFNYYKMVLPARFKKIVLAARVSMGYTTADAPFYEFQDQWSSEGSIEGLGGPFTLRGFKQNRFLGSLMSFNNLELRCRVAETKFLRQFLAFSVVPFADAGSVWDDFHFKSQIKSCEGLGLRIAWNVNTILRFDYAISREDRQFFFNFGHAF